MSKQRKAKIFIEAAVVITVTLALMMPVSAVVTNTTTGKLKQITISAMHEPISSTVAAGNILISAANPDEDDENPKITRDGDGNLVVTWEEVIDPFTKYGTVAYSTDGGETWEYAFQFDSTMIEGTGELISTDICYNPVNNQLFWTAVDPTADAYNLECAWIQSPITTAEEAIWFGVSGMGATEHYGACCGWVDKYAFTPYICDEPDYGLNQCPGLGYWDINFEHPPNMGGFYYDGGSILETTPALNIEADQGTYRLYMVMDVDGSKIAFKATTSDIELLDTKGGGPGGMDKYADIEVWPWQNWIATENAEDPDVSGDAGKVCVVYTQDGQVKCSYCHDTNKEYGEELVFETSVIGPGAYPCVYMAGDVVTVGYINEGNLYIVKSEDAGETWSTPERINEVDGTVVEQYRSIGITAGGIVWTDSRNGAKDIYYATTEKLPNLVIDSVSGGIGVSAVITNTGDATATNIDWSISLTGLVFLGGEASGTIASLAPGESATISSGFPFGFGSIDVGITAQCAEGASASASKEGKLLLFFVML